jgi:transcriptional/translational regulatory protein YebC/TACO1
VRHMFSRYNGNLGEQGCVSWMFDKKGIILLSKESAEEDALMEAALDAGADDINDEGSMWEVLTHPGKLETVKDALVKKGFKPESFEVSMVPQSTVSLVGKDASTMLKLMDGLEELDDTQHVYANFDISEEEMEKLSV